MRTKTERQLRVRAIAVVILLIAAAVFGIALGVRADTCATGTVEWRHGSPFWHDTATIDNVNTAVVGLFLWVQPDDQDVDDEYDGTVSVELDPGVIGATVCADGSVTLHRAAVDAPAPVDDPVIDLVALWGFDPAPRLMNGPF